MLLLELEAKWNLKDTGHFFFYVSFLFFSGIHILDIALVLLLSSLDIVLLSVGVVWTTSLSLG